MAVAPELSLVRLFLVISLLFPGPAAAQNPIAKPKTGPTKQAASSTATEQQSSSTVKPSPEDDFHRRVAVRWQAARKGLIQLYVTPDSTNGEAYRVRVVVTRAPEGSDGMRAPAPTGTANWQALIRLDDELRVRLTSESAEALIIEPTVRGSSALIRHLDPGGHAEWTWIVRKKGPGGDRILLEAERGLPTGFLTDWRTNRHTPHRRYSDFSCA